MPATICWAKKPPVSSIAFGKDSHTIFIIQDNEIMPEVPSHLKPVMIRFRHVTMLARSPAIKWAVIGMPSLVSASASHAEFHRFSPGRSIVRADRFELPTFAPQTRRPNQTGPCPVYKELVCCYAKRAGATGTSPALPMPCSLEDGCF